MATREKTAGAVDQQTIQLMYKRILLARGVEDLLPRWVKDNTFKGWWHPGRGQEGSAVGLMTALAPEDKIMWYHRGANWPVARGMPLAKILADLLGRTNGSVKGKGAGAPHWVDDELGLVGSGGTLGTAFVIAGGLALAKQVLGQEGIAVAGFGEGTAARGTFHETLIQAAVWKLPLLYLCENNGWAVATSFERSSPTATIAERASAYGIPGETVDGNDPVAVHEAAKRAADYVRAGNGPMILETRVQRLEGHYFGDMGSYRPEGEFDNYSDPVDVLREQVDPEARETIEAEAQAELDAAAHAALEGPIPGREVIFEDIYA
jgi:pyruvate dehydrogenase E1 component alpha subunit